jgi:hypothetical protein
MIATNGTVREPYEETNQQKQANVFHYQIIIKLIIPYGFMQFSLKPSPQNINITNFAGFPPNLLPRVLQYAQIFDIVEKNILISSLKFKVRILEF